MLKIGSSSFSSQIDMSKSVFPQKRVDIVLEKAVLFQKLAKAIQPVGAQPPDPCLRCSKTRMSPLKVCLHACSKLINTYFNPNFQHIYSLSFQVTKTAVGRRCKLYEMTIEKQETEKIIDRGSGREAPAAALEKFLTFFQSFQYFFSLSKMERYDPACLSNPADDAIASQKQHLAELMCLSCFLTTGNCFASYL